MIALDPRWRGGRNIPPVATAQGYGDLIRWACREVFPSIDLTRQAALFRLAAQVNQHSSLRVLECGLELHHDGSGRIDLLFHSQSRFLSLSTMHMPAWWHALVRASDPPDGTEVFGDGVTEPQGSHRWAPDSKPPLLYFSGWHWLEFDQSSSGAFGLAGLFQHCSTPDSHDPNAWNQALDHFHAVGCCPEYDLRRSVALQLVFNTFGLPMEWGFMVGRPEGLKLLANLDGIDADHLLAFCRQAGIHPAAGNHSDLVRWCRMIATPPKRLRFAISLDLDLASDKHAPNIGIEVYGSAGQGGNADAVDTWTALDPLLRRCGIDRPVRSSVHLALQALPRGQQEHVCYGGLEAFLAEELLTQRRIAFHNHLKLVFLQGHSTKVKSYVSLRLHKGAARA